jgi:hypothetical protein
MTVGQNLASKIATIFGPRSGVSYSALLGAVTVWFTEMMIELLFMYRQSFGFSSSQEMIHDY